MVSDVVISQDDSEGVVLAKLMDWSVAIRSDCFEPGIGMILAKVMKVGKEISTDNKNARAAPAGGRAAGSLLWGPERQGGRARRRGADGGNLRRMAGKKGEF